MNIHIHMHTHIHIHIHMHMHANTNTIYIFRFSKLEQSHHAMFISSGVCKKKAGQPISLNLPVPLTPSTSNVDCVQPECAERAKKKLEFAKTQAESCFNFGRMGVRGRADTLSYYERSSFFFCKHRYTRVSIYYIECIYIYI